MVSEKNKNSKKDNISVEEILNELIPENNVKSNDIIPFQNNNEYEYYLYCKHQLEILIATGKCKEFTGKTLTFQELDNMKPDQIIKNFKIYEAARTARINDAISETVVKGYSKLCNYIIPIENENKLYNDLTNDYLVMTELNKWVGYLSFQLGGIMTLLSTGIITFSNTKITNDNKNLSIINERSEKSGGDNCDRKTDEKTAITETN